MTVGKGKNMSEWLGKVTEDQNLNQLSEIENVVYDTLRQLFLSAQIQPDINMGYYDDDESRVVLGIPPSQKASMTSPYDMKDIVVLADTASTASTEWTVTTGEQWIILGAFLRNDTDNFQPMVTITPSGGTAMVTKYGADYAPTRTLNNINCVVAHSITSMLVLDGGDKLKLEDETFTAADVISKVLLYVPVAIT